MDATGITGKRTVPSDDAMARDNDRERVIVIGHSYGACGSRTSNRLRDLAISPRFSVRNPEQLTPDRLLEGRSYNVKLQVESSPLRPAA